MLIHLIGTVREEIDTEPIGFVLYDSDAKSKEKSVMVQPYNKVLKILKSGKARILGLDIDEDTGKIKGSNGSLDRYTKVDRLNRTADKSLVILNSYDDSGFRVLALNNNLSVKVTDISKYDAVKILSENKDSVGIANGKLVTKGRRSFISAINGNYINIEKPKAKRDVEMDAGLDRLDKDEIEEKISKLETVEEGNRVRDNINNKANTMMLTSYRLPYFRAVKEDEANFKIIDERTGLNLEEKMLYLLTALGNFRPFYATVFRMINKRLLKPENYPSKQGTMCVTDDTIYICTDFLRDTPLPELIFITMHEICHIIMKHRVRMQGRDPQVWNLACDLFINKSIQEEFKLKMNGEPIYVWRGLSPSDRNTIHYKRKEEIDSDNTKYKVVLPPHCLFDRYLDTATETPEIIYEMLLEEIDKQKKDDDADRYNAQSGQREGNGESRDKNSTGNSSQGNKNSKGKNSTNDKSDNLEEMDDDSETENGDSTNSENSNGNNSSGDSKDGKKSEETDGNGDSEGNTKKDDVDYNGNNSSGDSKDGKKSEETGETGETGENCDSEGNTKKDDVDYNARMKKSRFEGVRFRDVDLSTFEPDLAEDENSKSKSETQSEAAADALLRRAATIYKQTNKFGTHMDGFLERFIQEEIAPKINWRSLLKSKLVFASQKINTFAAPDKRFRSRGMIMPGPKALENDSLKNVKVCIDTSGSISDIELGMALSQIKQLLDTYKAEAELIYWDTAVRAEYQFKDIKDIMNKKPCGGGGTDVNCLFARFKESKEYRTGIKAKPSIIIIFTDGYFSEVLDKYGCFRNDIIWVINGNNGFKSKFGKVAPFKIKNTFG